jgi:hypothetical protein
MLIYLIGRYVLGIDEAEAFSECLTRELRALDNANVHVFLESDPLVDEVSSAKKSHNLLVGSHLSHCGQFSPCWAEFLGTAWNLSP